MTDIQKDIKEALENKMSILKQRIEIRKDQEYWHDEEERLKAFHERLEIYEEVEMWLLHQQELIDQLQGEIKEALEDRDKFRQMFHEAAKDFANALAQVNQKDAEIKRLRVQWELGASLRLENDQQAEEIWKLREALEQITRYRYGSALVYVTHIKGIAEHALSQFTPIKGESNE
jgi:chromosome segregation ATPase